MSEEAQTEEEAQEELEVPEPRLKSFYREEVVPQLMERFSYGNRHAVPGLQKIVLNMGVGEATEDSSLIGEAKKVLRVISGQEPVTTIARKNVAGFHLRGGTPIGTKVTLRRGRMYEFLDRLISVVMPRIRDFRGLSPKSFDGTGNYSMGINEHFVFPEVDADEFEKALGLDITICTSAESDEECHEFLRLMGMPFREAGG
jgi:large subunit ribosomal protein L5